jgi:predicted ribosomally synthesized peptide with SipW-like signal peptide
MKKEKKSILLSLLVIGAVALLITAGTTATFTDQVTSTGNEVEAAVIAIAVDDQCILDTGREGSETGSGGLGGANVDDQDGCTFTANNFTATELLPTESDDYEFNVKNQGTRAGDLTVSAVNLESLPAACDEDNWEFSYSPETHTLDIGEEVDVTVTVTLKSTAGNVCQDATLTFDVQFDFEQNTVVAFP